MSESCAGNCRSARCYRRRVEQELALQGCWRQNTHLTADNAKPTVTDLTNSNVMEQPEWQIDHLQSGKNQSGQPVRIACVNRAERRVSQGKTAPLLTPLSLARINVATISGSLAEGNLSEGRTGTAGEWATEFSRNALIGPDTELSPGFWRELADGHRCPVWTPASRIRPASPQP